MDAAATPLASHRTTRFAIDVHVFLSIRNHTHCCRDCYKFSTRGRDFELTRYACAALGMGDHDARMQIEFERSRYTTS